MALYEKAIDPLYLKISGFELTETINEFLPKGYAFDKYLFEVSDFYKKNKSKFVRIEFVRSEKIKHEN